MKLSYCFICSALLLSVPLAAQNRYDLIPRPAELTPAEGQFRFHAQTLLVVPAQDAEIRRVAQQFANRLNTASGLNVRLVTNATTALTPGGQVLFTRSRDTAALGTEGYRLRIEPERLVVEATQPAGFFYATQSLLQLLPPEVLGGKRATNVTWAVPCATITDRPRFGYRGLHLDVGRHFFPVSFVKKYIDLLAFHKMNTFHWHLTDDQGWRIEIKRYPRLTRVGSRRKESLVGQYFEYFPQRYDGQPHGGYYTQAQIRDVIRYAQARHVTIIPEIELPGHALAALAAYPELGCAGGPYQVTGKWGVHPEVFCPTEKTFTFLQNVLSEVIALFPSRYIHIGGDECPKDSWKASTFCQELIRREGLKDEHELQSWFIRRIEKFVNAKGRAIIGWDEILEGGLAPNATVMSWRGTQGGIEAARQNHDVIMTPGNFCYLDHYQAHPATEPLAIGAYTPLEETYSYEPVPTELTPEQARHILGAQGNLWTEYIQTPAYAEYMAYPRAAALAEIGWTPKELKDYADFSQRLPAHFARLAQLKVNASKAFFEARPTATPRPDSLQIALASAAPGLRYTYTMGGPVPTAYDTEYPGPLVLRRVEQQPPFQYRPVAFQAASFAGRRPVGPTTARAYFVSKSTGKTYRFTTEPSRTYADASTPKLTDGQPGHWRMKDRFVGLNGQDFEIVLDLGQTYMINDVAAGFLTQFMDGIFPPKSLDVSLSADGESFGTAETVAIGVPLTGRADRKEATVHFRSQQARYLKIRLPHFGTIPPGYPGAGKPAWLLIDEVVVE
jgi:hexosaminidase